MTAETKSTHPIPQVGTDFDVEEYVSGYEFRADEDGGSYSPNENERALLIDAIHGVLSELSLYPSPSVQQAEGREVHNAIATLQAFLDDFDRENADDIDADDFNVGQDDYIEVPTATLKRVLSALSPAIPAQGVPGVDLVELKRLAEAATRGPWTTCVRMGGDAIVDAPTRPVSRIDYRRDEVSRDADAAYIAAASPAVILKLIAALTPEAGKTEGAGE